MLRATVRFVKAAQDALTRLSECPSNQGDSAIIGSEHERPESISRETCLPAWASPTSPPRANEQPMQDSLSAYTIQE